MTTEELIEHTKKLIAIPSVSSDHQALHEAANYVADIVKTVPGVTIERFERNGIPSFLAYKGSKRPKQFGIILNGHVDVVPGNPDQFKLKLKDGKLYGRGVYDMKAACIIMAEAFCDYVNKVPYALGLQIVTDEENSGYDGSHYQITEGVRGDFVICGECGRSTNVHEIANKAKGIVVAEVGLSGNSTHSAYPWRGDSVAAKVSRFIDAVHERFPVPAEETKATTVTVTSIASISGAWTKTPDSASIKLDARYIPADPNFDSEEHFAALITSFDPDATILKIHDFSAPLYTDPANPLLLSLKASAEKIEGAPFSFAQRNATSDGRFYGDVGNQACEFGIAGEHQHGDDEHITLEAFTNYRATLQDFLAKTVNDWQPAANATHSIKKQPNSAEVIAK